MDRRHVLRLLALSGVLLSSLARKALSQASMPQGDPLATPPGVAPQLNARGLPADWRFVAPTRWSTVDASLHAKLTSPLRDSSPLDLAGIRVGRSGEIELGGLDPVGASIALPASVASIIGPANEVLSLEVLNRDYNPFLDVPQGPDGKPLIGPFQRPAELYQGKTILPSRLIMAKLFEMMALPPPAMQPLIGALSEVVVIRAPAHQFRLGDAPGNRVVFYGTELDNGQRVDLGHAHIDQLATELGKQHLRLIKQMVHFNGPAQGGTPENIVGDGVAGSTHAGGFSAGYDKAGNPIAVKSDWPSNYGALSDYDKTYNAHLIAIDYAGACADPIPDAALKAYCHNADMWDCCAAMLVPFADRDPDPAYRDYEYNPLEVYDQKSARDVAAALALFDSRSFLDRHGAFYCAEGQYVVANLGPQEDEQGGTLLKQSRFGETAFGRLIANFIAAPGYAGMSAEERARQPFAGWSHLRTLGPDNGGISVDQYTILRQTDRLGVALDWVPEDVKGWQAYRPEDKEALIARPMTVATLAWGLLRIYMPRDRVAHAIAADLARAHAEGNEDVKRGVTLLTGGRDPASPQGRALLAVVGAKAATGLLLGLLASDQVRASLLYKAGYFEITSEEDKEKVRAAYDAFLGILQNADYSTQGSLDQALAEADAKLGALVVTRSYYNRTTRERVPAKSTVMKYAAPPCYGMWAQQPFFADTACLRYVATAMHVSQKKSAAS